MDMIPYEQRYEVTHRGWTYLLSDDDHTAWLVRGSLHRCKRFCMPQQVTIQGSTYTVESIEMGAFCNCNQLRHLVIPDSVRYIDEDSFCFLPNLRSVYIGRNVERLRSWHFRGCPKLSSIVIAPDSLYLKIVGGLLLSQDGKTLWRAMKQMAKVDIPEGVETIASCALWYNDKLEHITFPLSLRRIEDSACANLPRLRKVVLPEGVTDLVVQCFYECVNLQEVVLPSTLTHLGCEVFAECPNLRKLIFCSSK